MPVLERLYQCGGRRLDRPRCDNAFSGTWTAIRAANTAASAMNWSGTSASPPTNSAAASASTSTSSTSAPNKGATSDVRTCLSEQAGRRRDAPGFGRAGRRDRTGIMVLARLVQLVPAHHHRGPGDRQHRHGLRGTGASRQLRRRGLLTGALHHLHPGPCGSCRWPGQRTRSRDNRCRASELEGLARRQRSADPVPGQPQRVRLQRHPGRRYPGHPAAPGHHTAGRSERARRRHRLRGHPLLGGRWPTHGVDLRARRRDHRLSGGVAAGGTNLSVWKHFWTADSATFPISSPCAATAIGMR